MSFKRKHILLIAADISDNSLGRVWILADMLSRYASVHIVGLATRGHIWPPLAGNNAHPITLISAPHLLNVLGTLRLLGALWHMPGDVLYVCKPKFPSMVAALLGSRRRRLVLDIDDWEAGCARGGFSSSPLVNALSKRGISFTQIADRMIPLIRRRTVCNMHFQSRYGGTLVPHARNAAAFSHAPQDIASLRRKFGLPNEVCIVMFFGTPHKHKGIDELIEAMALAKDKRLHMLVAGLNPAMQEFEGYRDKAEQTLSGRYSFLPFIPWQEAPALLACADILVVPQRHTVFTAWGQTPAKIFDAMAAGKPLVLSDIADTAELVKDTAWLVPPDDPNAIALALDAITADLPAALMRAKACHERFLANYTYDCVAPALATAVLGEPGQTPPPAQG